MLHCSSQLHKLLIMISIQNEVETRSKYFNEIEKRKKIASSTCQNSEGGSKLNKDII